MLDLHSHVLPRLDDGAATDADSLEMARAAVAAGIEQLVATPHVRADYPTTPAAMQSALAELRARLAQAGVPLILHGGGEIALDRLDELDREERAAFALGGSRFLLIEFPYFGWPVTVHERLFRLQLDGFVPVIAHPERCAEVKAAPELLEPLVAAGALVQVTAASLDGRLGRRTQQTALTLVERELAHLVASDAHTAAVREIGMVAAVAAIDDEALGRWLTVDVPRAILENDALPPRPAGTRAGRHWWRR